MRTFLKLTWISTALLLTACSSISKEPVKHIDMYVKPYYDARDGRLEQINVNKDIDALLLKNTQKDFDNQTSLLNFLEQHQIHHEYQCRSGYCGSCRVKIKKGKVSYAEAPLAFIQPDEILLCCCRVESDIELEL